MKGKILKMIEIGCITLCGIFAVLTVMSDPLVLHKTKAEKESLVLKLDGKKATDVLTASEANAGEFTRSSPRGNPITFKTSGSSTVFDIVENNKWCRVKTGGYIYNETPMSGLSKISLTGNWDYTVSIHYGETQDYGYTISKFVPDGVTVDFDLTARGVNIRYFKYEIINLTHPDATATRFMEFTYACDETPAPVRGERFTLGTDKTVSFDKVYTANDSMAIDVKLDDSTGKLSVAFYNNAWDHYYGQYDLCSTTNQTGIYVRQLPDGYIRFIIVFGELNRTDFNWNRDNAPETVTLMSIRSIWCTSSAYVDAEPTIPVTGENGLPYEVSTCDGQAEILKVNIGRKELSATVSFDVYFNNIGQHQELGISYCQTSSSSENRYGIFWFDCDTKHNGAWFEESYSGLSFELLENGWWRVTAVLAELGSKTGNPTYIEYISIRQPNTKTNRGSGFIAFDYDSPSSGDAELPIEGAEPFYAGDNYTVDLPRKLALTESMSFDIKFKSASETSISFCLGEGWGNYYGYYKVYANGTLGNSYPGVSISSLENGYYRVSLDISLLATVNCTTGNPNEYVNLFYIRGAWSDADGYIKLNIPEAPEREPVQFEYQMTSNSCKVAVFTDLHLDGNNYNNPNTIAYATIDYAMNNSNPDLCVFTGDFAWGISVAEKLCDFMDNYEKPYFFILGNHDHDANSPYELAEAINASDYGHFELGPTSLESYGNYIVKIKNSSGELVHGLIMMDTRNKRTVDPDKVEYITDPVPGVAYGSYGDKKTYCEGNSGYDGVRGPQLEWYEDTVDELDVESTLFVHAGFEEYCKAYEAYMRAVNASDTALINSFAPIGNCTMGEPVCGSANNFGFFDLIKEHGLTKNVICGHDHANDFSLLYQGVRLTYALKVGDGAYWNESTSGYTEYTIDSTGSTTTNHVYYH
ncbi:MAG: metallophosphoesterase [Bacilli bacterium]|nr:metallophosphoesterase [Bacilli bacterium]